MKHKILLTFFNFFAFCAFSQPITIVNGTKFPIEVKIIKEGIVIHHHVMNYKDQVTVKDVGWYGTKFMVKYLTDDCTNTPIGNCKPEFEDGWYWHFYTKKWLQDYHEYGGTLQINPPICKCQPKA